MFQQIFQGTIQYWTFATTNVAENEIGLADTRTP